MKYALMVLGMVLAVGISIAVVGMCTAKDHETSMARDYNASAKTVYALVRNYEDYPKWRTGVKSMARDGELRYIEESGHGKIPYRIVEERENAHMVSRIDDATLPFSGTWTFDIAEQDGKTQLRITERGSVPNPIWRFFSAYVFSHEKTVRTYLEDVARQIDGK
nr:SRPBCC family protein [uncultured Duganella sp.]